MTRNLTTLTFDLISRRSVVWNRTYQSDCVCL